MTAASMLRLLCRICRTACPLWLCSVPLLGIGVSGAQVGFMGYYAPANFTLTNNGGGVDQLTGAPTANGSVMFPNLLTLILTGTNDGSGIPGYTDVTTLAVADGVLQFDYLFTTQDIPSVQYAGYVAGSGESCGPLLPGCGFFFLSDENGAPNASGTISVPVRAGELIGFRAGGDGQGYPAVLTISNFSAPIPEPGTFQLVLLAAVVAGCGVSMHRCRIRGS